ncbi:MAG: Coq4 family protein [Myxococcota bacterium]
MTSASEPLRFEIRTHRARPRRSWRRAFRALRELLSDPDRTYLAFDINLALDPEMAERGLLRMLEHPEGRRVFAARPCLREHLCNRAALAALPEESFGRAYLAHLDRHSLDPAKLAVLGRETDRRRPHEDRAVMWARERQVMTHDLLHVLTGYGADSAGESALLLFSLGQVGGYSNLVLSFGANARMLQERGFGWLRIAWRAWRRGRRATCLGALPYEELLPLPLAAVGAAAEIEPLEPA